MTKQPIRFWFDYLSPYAYLASTRLGLIEERHGVTIRAEPVLLAGLLGATGRLGPAEVPAQRVHTFTDALRVAADLGVELRCPWSHPFNPLLPLRATAATAQPRRRSVVHAIYKAVWVDRVDVTSPPALSGLLTQCGVDAEETLERAVCDDVKRALRENTDEALAAGAFGVPTFEVSGKLYWGVQSIPHLERHLEGLDDVDPEEIERWKRLEPSATRQRRPE
jgi:2-hydroxychromene-2-carboxylate isomerase